MFGSGIIRHFYENWSTRTRLKIDDRRRRIPRFHVADVDRVERSIHRQFLKRLSDDGTGFQITGLNTTGLKRIRTRNPSQYHSKAEEYRQRCLAHDYPPL